MHLYTVFQEEELQVLRQPAAEVTTEEFNSKLERLSREMLDFMHKNDGIGLAAPQIGISKRIFVMQLPEEEPMVIINPRYQELLETPSRQCYEEGCLSIPGFNAEVERFAAISVEAKDIKGKIFSFEARELLAVCVQHECDHLDGVLFVDHLKRSQQRLFWNNVKHSQGTS